ncbi:hypothetical protein CEUSTIGMA_g10794.t1 [Chlamydomonas eustigma]|uniref:Nonsense-mediated mRNA decay factor SMG8 n=1 Tax=Chlamydomonas eustigma TaxID=1157962 RepID=A0A250XKB2_9CHLO|nr:hypothetical protein CEUSTIGMA_g10794.t1 [Chlamydomonas eustigma]|eukprot:GAX83369.1 hypothetical protein CEUSTIGMA_g10794.t1 [Chlamydomonas eustigma]
MNTLLKCSEARLGILFDHSIPKCSTEHMDLFLIVGIYGRSHSENQHLISRLSAETLWQDQPTCCLPPLALPHVKDRLLKAFLDEQKRILYISTCTTVSPSDFNKVHNEMPTNIGGLGDYKGLHQDCLMIGEGVESQLKLLQLFMMCHVVLMIQPDPELNTQWLSQLRMCRTAWGVLTKSAAKLMKRKGVERSSDKNVPAESEVLGTRTVRQSEGVNSHTAPAADKVLALLMSRSSKPPAVLSLVYQATSGVTAPQVKVLDSMVSKLLRLDTAGRQASGKPARHVSKAGPPNPAGSPVLWEVHDTMAALPVPPLTVSATLTSCCLSELIIDAECRELDQFSNLLDLPSMANLVEAYCTGGANLDTVHSCEVSAEHGLERLRLLVKECHQKLLTGRSLASTEEVGLSAGAPSVAGVKSAATQVLEVWTSLSTYMERGFVKVCEQNLSDSPTTELKSVALSQSQPEDQDPSPQSLPESQKRGQGAQAVDRSEDVRVGGRTLMRTGMRGMGAESQSHVEEDENASECGGEEEGVHSVRGEEDAGADKLMRCLDTSLEGVMQSACLRVQQCSNLLYNFSLKKSEKAVQAASKAYLMGLPQRYSTKAHRAALYRAQHLLSGWARGPAKGQASRQLKEVCETLWRQGRQQCEAVSVTGRPCILEAGHNANGSLRDGREGQGVSHQSGFLVTRSTVTGKIQKTIPDEFSVHQANRFEVHAVSEASKQDLPTSETASKAKVQTGVSVGAPAEQPAGGVQSKDVSLHSSQGVALNVQSKADGVVQQLGHWLSLTVMGPASTYDERRGIQQPGLQPSGKLFPLILQLPIKEPVASPNEPAHQRNSGRQQTHSRASQAAESFPSLSEAVSKKADRGGQKQGRSKPHSKTPATKTLQLGSQKGAAADDVHQYREQSLCEMISQVWPGTLEHTPAAHLVSGLLPTSNTVTLSAATSVPPTGSAMVHARNSAWSSGVKHTEPLLGPTSKGSLVAGKRDIPAPGGSGLTQAVVAPSGPILILQVAVEYESLDGRRFFPSPQQLGVDAKGATTQRPGQSKSGLSSAALARFLLTEDLPIFLEASTSNPGQPAHTPLLKQQQIPPSSNQPNQASPSDVSGHPTSLAVLRRIWVVTPPSSQALFCSKPIVEMKQCSPLLLEPEAALATIEAQSSIPAYGHASIKSTNADKGVREEVGISAAALVQSDVVHPQVRSSTNSGNQGEARSTTPLLCELQYKPGSEMKLPPDCFCVITLPNVYAAPYSWLAPSAAGKISNTSSSKESSVTQTSPPLLPIFPLKDNWPFSARLLKGTLLYPNAQ